MATAVQEVRSFNRFYTAKVGLLGKRFLDTDFSLPEARVLFELATGRAETAADLVRGLHMDKGHVSRILERFRTRGLVEGRPSPTHGKRIILSLTEAGRAAFALIDERQEAETGRMIAGLDADAARRLSCSMRAIKRLLETPDATEQPGFSLRGPRPGELGWVVSRQGAIYHEEHGWGFLCEAEIARVAFAFFHDFDGSREQCWIAERDGEAAGAIFLTKTADRQVGQLRLLHVEPFARGLGVGAGLVAACVSRAREADYHRLDLWTHAALTDARRLYQRAGFRLVAEEVHRVFGPDLHGETWSLQL